MPHRKRNGSPGYYKVSPDAVDAIDAGSEVGHLHLSLNRKSILTGSFSAQR